MPQVLSGMTELVLDDSSSYDNHSENSEPNSLDSGPSDNIVSNGDVGMLLCVIMCDNEITVNSWSMNSNCCNTVILDDIALHICAHTNLEVSKNELKLIWLLC